MVPMLLRHPNVALAIPGLQRAARYGLLPTLCGFVHPGRDTAGLRSLENTSRNKDEDEVLNARKPGHARSGVVAGRQPASSGSSSRSTRSASHDRPASLANFLALASRSGDSVSRLPPIRSITSWPYTETWCCVLSSAMPPAGQGNKGRHSPSGAAQACAMERHSACVMAKRLPVLRKMVTSQPAMRGSSACCTRCAKPCTGVPGVLLPPTMPR
mmetsp:Transcript_660/g.1648  ORF Transcript_660/g.1648 Transcript_660/m.1648 type:complete len:214 (-) Transcript_660:930-1571(-)